MVHTVSIQDTVFEGVKRDSEESHLLKTVASGGAWHSEEEGEEALLTRLKDWAKSPPK